MNILNVLIYFTFRSVCVCPHVQARGKGRFAPASDTGFLSPIRASSSRAPSSSTQMPLQRLRGEEFGCRPNSSEVVIVCFSLFSFLCCVFSFCSLPVSCSLVKVRIRSVCVCPHVEVRGKGRFAPASDTGFLSPIRA